MSDEILFKNPNRNRILKKANTTPEHERLNLEPLKVEKNKSLEAESRRRIAELKRLEQESDRRDVGANKLLSVGESYPNSLFNSNNGEISEDKVYNEPILAESIPDPPSDPYQAEQEKFSFHNDVVVGEYMLLHNDKIIEVGNDSAIIDVLSTIINGDDNFKMEDFAVFKKVNLNIGIFIKD